MLACANGLRSLCAAGTKPAHSQQRLGEALQSHGVVLLYSDGIRESFELHDCPGLLAGSAKEIAERVMKAFRKQDDDASCLVLRYTA